MPANNKPLFTTLQFTPKTYDLDYAGVLHNSVHILWLEDLRVKMLQKMMTLDQLHAQNLEIALVNTNINYRLPIRFNDVITGEMWVDAIPRTSWRVKAEFKDPSGKLYFDAMQTGVFVTQKAGEWRPSKIPDAALEIYRRDAEQDKPEDGH